MLTKHNYPREMFIELSGITNLIKHLLNELSRNAYVTMEIAHKIAIWILRYNLDSRCLWLKNPNSHMGIHDKENLFADIELTPHYKNYLINDTSDVFAAIQLAISELLDGHVPRETWHIWSMRSTAPFTVCLRDDGDYRIVSWINEQESNNTDFTRIYDYNILRSYN